MDLTDLPYKFQHVWATGAGAGPIVDPIPDTGAVSGHASQQTGYSLTNMQPTGAGGIPPWGSDENGVLKYLTSWTQWVQASGPVPYDATFQGWIGGYPLGAIVVSGTYAGAFWLSLIDDNTSDPDTGGANWSPYPVHGAEAFSSPGVSSFTVPAWVTTVDVEVWGGGGGSGGTLGAGSGSGGGAAGGYAVKRITGLLPGAVITVTVGAGGVAGNSTPTNGTAGGTSSFGMYVSASGGNGGTGANGAVASLPVTGGGGSGGDVNIQGGSPSEPFALSAGIIYAANGGAAAGVPGSMAGWSSSIQVGTDGAAPGGGAVGAVNGGVGGNGAAGAVIVRW
jgi:hypothetical protein